MVGECAVTDGCAEGGNCAVGGKFACGGKETGAVMMYGTGWTR